MSRNFSLGSRNMAMAGTLALKRGMKSFSSIATMSNRWSSFVTWANEQGINRMEHIELADLVSYGEHIAELVECGDMAASTAQNYISAVNRVLEMARGDRQIRVSPTKDCGIPHRSGIATEDKAMSEAAHRAALLKVSDRAAAIMELQLNFGMRFEESAKFSARSAVLEARRCGTVTIEDGAKGGRKRKVPITSEHQVAALDRAAEIQGVDRSMIPPNQSYVNFQRQMYREAAAADIRFHSERHAFAQHRYEALVGAPCPVAAGVEHGRAHYEYLATYLGISIAEAQELDRKNRKQIAEELGHGRAEITSAYLG